MAPSNGQIRRRLTHRPPHGLDALGGEVTFLLQLLHDALGGVIHAQ